MSECMCRKFSLFFLVTQELHDPESAPAILANDFVLIDQWFGACLKVIGVHYNTCFVISCQITSNKDDFK